MSGFVKAIEKAGSAFQTRSVSPHKTLRSRHEAINLSRTHKIPINPEALKKRGIYIRAEDPNSAAMLSAHKYLRTSVLAKMDQTSAQTLMVTSPAQGNGKTTVALNLAINIARLEQRTALLVDLDLRRPSVHYNLGFEPKFGVVDVASGKVRMEQVLVTPMINRLTVLPGGRRYSNSSEIIASKAMQALIKEVKNRYRERIIIFDTPPLQGCDDVMALSPMMDACLIVVEENKTRFSELNEAMAKLGDINQVGYVLNKSHDRDFERNYY